MEIAKFKEKLVPSCFTRKYTVAGESGPPAPIDSLQVPDIFLRVQQVIQESLQVCRRLVDLRRCLRRAPGTTTFLVTHALGLHEGSSASLPLLDQDLRVRHGDGSSKSIVVKNLSRGVSHPFTLTLTARCPVAPHAGEAGSHVSPRAPVTQCWPPGPPHNMGLKH